MTKSVYCARLYALAKIYVDLAYKDLRRPCLHRCISNPPVFAWRAGVASPDGIPPIDKAKANQIRHNHDYVRP